jgi:guanine deaminase
MLQKSAQMAAASGAYWQTHLSEDLEDCALALEVHAYAQDYLDIYDRAGALTRKSIFAHSVHLSDQEVARLIEAGCTISHCPSNLFGAGGLMDLGRYFTSGIPIGLGSDVGGCTDISLFKAIELGWVCQTARAKLTESTTVVTNLEDWFYIATLGGAKALGLSDHIGSLEVSKDADIIAVDVERLRIVPGSENEDSRQVLNSMIFRRRPDMVRHAWVRGRKVSGPGMFDKSSQIKHEFSGKS